MNHLLTRLLEHPALDLGLVVFSLLAALVSVALVPRFLAGLPSDYLRGPPHRLVHPVLRVARNFLGLVLVLLGVAMLVLPGQGLLTLLVGAMLLDFPGKHQVVVRLLSRPRVLRLVNRLRAHYGAEPLSQ